MLLLRMGVGVGEAALSPAAYSLITDYFPRERLATALSVYSMGIYVGSGMAYLLGGLVVAYASTQAMWTIPLLGAVHPWQVIFLLVGLPGIALAPLLFTVNEPAAHHGARQRSTVPMRQVFSYIFENRRTFLLHNIGFGLHWFWATRALFIRQRRLGAGILSATLSLDDWNHGRNLRFLRRGLWLHWNRQCGTVR